MAELIVMCGLQGSGKSTKAKELASLKNATVLSSDELRKIYPEAKNETIFSILYKQMNELLKDGKSVVIDATNTSIKSRRQIFLNLKEKCTKTCYIMNTDYETCIHRVEKRNLDLESHKVPIEVVKNYYHSFEIPFYEEGWDDIIVDNIPTRESSKEILNNLLERCDKFNQNNKHHTQLLGEHMKTVSANLLLYISLVGLNTDSLALFISAKYHDIGKLFTQTYKEGDPNAHYYNHANVGAYYLLCNCGFLDDNNLIDKDFFLKVLFYINYHMQAFDIKTDKSKKKWSEIFGEKNLENLFILNNADKTRP